jgi:hypothetical protein
MASDNFTRDVLATGAIATVTTTLAALGLSKAETGSTAAGLNATSHILWGEKAFRKDSFDWRHTALGAVLNAGAMASWATAQRLLFPRPRTLLGAACTGVAVSAIAYVVDYYMVPKRLTPGFEARLTRSGLFTLYGVLAGALAAGARLAARRT